MDHIFWSEGALPSFFLLAFLPRFLSHNLGADGR